MTFEQELDSLKQRIARAEVLRDAWRASGQQEPYLEACSMVAALSMQHTMLCMRRSDEVPSPPQ